MTTENSEGKQTTPDLDQAMREGQAVFDGTIPPDGGAAAPLAPGKTGPEGAGEAAAEAAAGKGEGEAAAGKGGAGDDEARRAAAEAAAGAGKGGAAGETGKGEGGEGGAAGKKEGDTPPGTAPRFKSHEEAEKGYRELQGKTTKAEQRAKALEDELDRVKNADKIREEEQTRRTEVMNFAAERRIKALEDIDGLDPEDGEYRKKAGEILSRADIEIFEHYQARSGKPAAAGTGEPAAGAAGAEGAGRPGKDAEMEQVVGYIQEKIAGEGLEKDDPLFWQYAGLAPVKDDKGAPTKLDDQIRWAVDQTKQYHNRIQAKARSADEAAAAEETRRRQAAELPLGRGTAGAGAAAGGGKPPAEEIKQPISLSDAIDAALDQRRL